MRTNKRIRWLLKWLFFAVTGFYVGPPFARLSFGVYDNYFSSSISFNLDSLFLNWNTTFPAVTVCEIYNGEKIWDISEEHFGTHHNLQVDDFVGEIVFFRGVCSSCQKCERSLECPQNFTELLHLFRTKCSDLIINCSYTDKPFNCCDEFRPIHTEYGICYAFNSNQARKTGLVQFTNNRATGPGRLQFDAITDIQIHVHPPIDIPYLYSEGMIRETVLLGSFKEIIINVQEIFNDASVDGLSPKQRQCRFSRERTPLGKELNIYDLYSYSTCVVECTLRIEMMQCNCTNHLLADAYLTSSQPAPVCNYSGLKCLTEHNQQIQWKRKSCDCLSSCEEPEYYIAFNSPEESNELSSEKTEIIVSLMELPTQRYIRRVTKDSLDFIISLGGLAGLFFSASLLRVVELVFMTIEYGWSNIYQVCRFFHQLDWYRIFLFSWLKAISQCLSRKI